MRTNGHPVPGHEPQLSSACGEVGGSLPQCAGHRPEQLQAHRRGVQWGPPQVSSRGLRPVGAERWTLCGSGGRVYLSTPPMGKAVGDKMVR